MSSAWAGRATNWRSASGALKTATRCSTWTARPILAVPTDLAEELDATIDVEQTQEGARLVLT